MLYYVTRILQSFNLPLYLALYSFVTYQVLGAGTIEEFLTMYRTFSRHELTRRDAGQKRKEKKTSFCHAVSVVGVLKPENLQRQARDRNRKNSKKSDAFRFRRGDCGEPASIRIRATRGAVC